MPALRNFTGSTVPFGPIERKKSLSQLYALCQYFGLPSWFLTISPSDIDSPIVMKLSCPENDDIELILAKSEQRAHIAAMNPIAGSVV